MSYIWILKRHLTRFHTEDCKARENSVPRNGAGTTAMLLLGNDVN